MERADDPFAELKEKFVPTFARSCLFWLPAQTINFYYVAPRFRVVYVGACALIWVNILCWIKRQGSPVRQALAETKEPAQSSISH